MKFFKTALALSLLLTIAYSYTGEIIKDYDTPGRFPTGLTFDGENLWLADRETDQLYCLNPETGETIRTIPAPSYWPMGLTWDGKYLWCSDNKTKNLYCIDREQGNIVKTIDYPEKVPEGLAFDGKYLWCCDTKESIIVQISTIDGTTIRTFPAPSEDPRGICFDGEYLWISDRMEDKIYMVDDETGNVIFAIDAPSLFSRGLAFGNGALWNVDHHTDKIYKMKVRDGEKLRKFNKHIAKTYLTNKVQNFGPGKILTMDIYFALPVERDNQKMLSDFEFSQKPDNYIVDQWGQKTAQFHYENIDASETVSPVMEVESELYEVQYFIYPEKVGSMKDIPKEIRKQYLVDDEKYQLTHPVIQKAVKKAVGNETNPYWIARNLYNYLIDNMFYLMVGGWNTAPTVLERGNGSCSEYSFVYTALCRAAGIPARYVGAVVIRGDDTSYDRVFHRWCEIYLPNYGWIPVDPSSGDKEKPALQAERFGHLHNRYLITTQSGGGSKTMGWTYNFNQIWQTEPQTEVHEEHFADWEVLEK